MKATSITGFALLVLAGAVLADDAAELAKKSLNPIAAMYSLPMQYNWNQKLGPSGEGMHSVTNVQPVLPFSINEDWNLISRTILPLIDQHGLAPNGQADASGVGDVTQSLFFSPVQNNESGWIWGVGPAFLLPTGSDDLLTEKQWAAGPTAVGLKQANGWTIGALGNHLWSLNSIPADDRQKINATFLQPFLSYTTSTYTSFGINSESIYDWKARDWSVPINLTLSQLVKVGGVPVSLQVGPRYWVESSENGAEGWGARAAVTLLFPK